MQEFSVKNEKTVLQYIMKLNCVGGRFEKESEHLKKHNEIMTFIN